MASTTTNDDGFHEIQLNGKQLVFLFMAITTVSIVIFICGVLVGRGVRSDDVPAGSSAAEISPDQVEQAPVASAEPPPAVAAPASAGGAPATTREDLSYPEQLGGRDNKPEPLRPASPEPAATRTEPPAAAPSATASTPAATPAAPAASAGTPPRSAAAAAAAAAPAADSGVSPEPAGPGYAIQVAALRERREAETLVKRLSAKGYAAYLLAPAANAPAMYRIRVGKFKGRAEAQQVANRLQKEEKFKPWIVR